MLINSQQNSHMISVTNHENIKWEAVGKLLTLEMLDANMEAGSLQIIVTKF